MGIANTSAKSNTVPTPAASASQTESGQTAARIVSEASKARNSDAPKGQKIKTTSVVS